MRRTHLLMVALFLGMIAVASGNWGAAHVAAFSPANLVFGLTATNQLVRFNASTPGTLIGLPLAVTGLVAGDSLVAMDFRPATGQLYALGVNGTARLYTINTTTGAATMIGGAIVMPQSAGVVAGAAFGFDFNPTVDRIRVVADTRDNFRLNPDTGAVAGVDTALTAGAVVVGAAYDRNFSGSTQTTLFGIDSSADQLVLIGGVNGVPSPNTGTVIPVGNLGVNLSNVVGFDIAGDTVGSAYASVTVAGIPDFYTINLGTGAATLVGTIGTGAVGIRDIAVAPAGVLRFTTPTYTVSEAGVMATIVVNRVGGSFGALSVTVSTADGSASAGQDYTPRTVTLNFADGVTSQSFDIPILDDALVEGNETVILNFSNLVGDGLAGPSGLLTITDDEDGACVIWAVDSSNNLLHFSSDTPGTIVSPVPVTSLLPGERLVGIDFRPATGVLYALGVLAAGGRLYTINLTTGAATVVGVGFLLPQSAGVAAGADYGIDFNATVDRLRVVADSRDNFRLNPNTGGVAGVDTALTAGSIIVGAAYDRNFVTSPQPATTLYGIDANTDQLVTIGGINGVPSPNTGAVMNVGSLGFNTSTVVGFDIANSAEGQAYASLTVGGQPGLYAINLATGAATPIGIIGNGSVAMTGMAIAPAGTVQFSAASYAVLEASGVATITVTRTGGDCGSIIVQASTSDGTAVAPGDYGVTSVMLTFPEGVTSRTFTIPIVSDNTDEPNETLNLTLSANVGGRIGTPATSTLTIIDGVRFSIADSPECTGPGRVVTSTFTVRNSNTVPTAIAATVTLPAGLVALPGSCAATVGSCTVVNSSTVAYAATLAPGQTATVSYQGQVGDEVVVGTQLCSTLSVMFGGDPALTLQACVTTNCPAVGPGLSPQAISPPSDQKAGSVLFYNLFTSSATAPAMQNTRVNVTNTNPASAAFVHLFFVDGSTCSIADAFICLSRNQTLSFLASNLDPGTTGYIVAVVVDRLGCPVNFNYLIGDEYVKLATGHAANLGAEAISALAGGLPFCNASSTTAVLAFDGISYNLVPRALALDNIPDRASGNDTLLVVNRLGGNLTAAAGSLGAFFGLLYNDSEQSHSFSFSTGNCQLVSSLSNSFPRTSPRFESVIPGGRSGWLKLWSLADIGIFGAAINFNPNTPTSSGAFSQGHNLHKLTLSSAASVTIPIIPPSC